MTDDISRRSDDEIARSSQARALVRRTAGAHRTVPQGAAPAAGRRNIAVLIVEDSPLVCARLVELVTSVPHANVIGTAADGPQASALFRRCHPDAVVLDISLPGSNGMDLLAQFKRELPSCVVMVLTTYAFTEFGRRCAQLGADHFFDKATDFEQVTGVLHTLCSRAASTG